MSAQNASIVFSSSLDRLLEMNSSFDKGVLRVCYVGENRNGSSISKETFERCMSSIYNCPIVCLYDRERDELGEHNVDVVPSEDGTLSMVNTTQPVGVIPESAKHWWEEVQEADGAVHEYLCVDALLWKRQESYRKIKENGVTAESMEINILEGSLQDGVYVIERFEFMAFCLLGTAEPCFESAALATFSQDDFRAQFDEMMRELKATVSTVQPSEEVGIKTQNNQEGGNKTLDEKKHATAQFGLTQEQFCDELVHALSVEMVDTCFGPIHRYWYVDYDTEAMEVYCHDQVDWRLYGFTYSVSGDQVTIDFKSKKRKKFAIMDFDDGEQPQVFAEAYSVFSDKYEENEAQWEEKYQAASDTIATMQKELGELRAYKAAAEEESAAKEREEVFSQFGDLDGVEAFETLRADCAKYSAEELEEKCYAIRGRAQAQKFSLPQQGGRTPKLPVEPRDKVSPEPYGGVFAEYGITRK